MGNYASCTFHGPATKTSKAARVVFPSGEVRQFHESANVAELMMECPSYFLVNSHSLIAGRRFSALAADEDLELGNLYAMFPMKRVNSVVTATDVAVLPVAAKSAAKRISGGKVRVTPATVDDCRESENERPRLDLDEIGDNLVTDYKYRVGKHRSKKPMLDTITE